MEPMSKTNENSMKETVKQIKARVINEVNTKYAKRIEDTENSLKEWRTKYFEEINRSEELSKKNKELREENDSLKAKIQQYDEWIERMQDFCNLPEEERRDAFETYFDNIKSENESKEVFSNIMSMYSHFFTL